VILPQAPEAGKQYSITVQYEGDKVLDSAGDGSYYVASADIVVSEPEWIWRTRAVRPDLQGFEEVQDYQRGQAEG